MRSLLLLLPLAAFAQDAAPLKLTLHDAVALALKQNPQVILAHIGVGQAEQESRIVRSTLLPQAGANLNEAVHRVNLEAAIGFRFPNFAQHVGPYWTFQGGVEVNAPVFDLTLWRRFRSSQIGVESGRQQEYSVREDSVLLVVSQYLGSQRAAAEVQAAQSRVDLAQALYDQSADLQKNGVGTGIDTLRANVQLQNEKQRLIGAQTQLDTSLFGLVQLLNLDPHRKVELADQVSFFETPAVALDQTLEQAWEVRPEMRRLQADRRRAELEEKAAGEQRLPKLSFSGFLAQQGLAPAGVIPVYQYGWNLDVPLFTGGRIEAQRAEASLALRRLDQQEQDLRNCIAQEVKTAAARVESARNEVNVANLGITLARQEVEQARDRFQAGVANNIEVITAQDELSRANDNQIGALYRYNQSRADLAHAAGQMEALYAR